MKTADIINRIQPAPPWEYGEKIPWNDPEFSERMLQNHLSQDHDWASRREDLIEKQVAWIAGALSSSSARIIDLACGPGFYTQRLAQMGHQCLGVDFSPASIRYAKERAAAENLALEYVLSDIRDFKTNETFDCVVFVFGEFNVFKESDARAILASTSEMLKPGGLFIVEAHTFAAVEESGLAPASWWSCQAGEGVLSDQPHVCLQENYWDEAAATATSRYFILDGNGAPTKMYCSSMKGYSPADYDALFLAAGLKEHRVLTTAQWPVGPPFEGVMMTHVCRK